MRIVLPAFSRSGSTLLADMVGAVTEQRWELSEAQTIPDLLEASREAIQLWPHPVASLTGEWFTVPDTYTLVVQRDITEQVCSWILSNKKTKDSTFSQIAVDLGSLPDSVYLNLFIELRAKTVERQLYEIVKNNYKIWTESVEYFTLSNLMRNPIDSMRKICDFLKINRTFSQLQEYAEFVSLVETNSRRDNVIQGSPTAYHDMLDEVSVNHLEILKHNVNQRRLPWL